MKIALDGPAGAGKSTVAKCIAKELNINYLDTGAMYRGAAYYMLQKNIDVCDNNAVLKEIANMNISVRYLDNAQHIFMGEEDITSKIRTPQVTKASSDIAVIKEIRLKLVDLQREVGEKYDIVMDGRDIGTYVLPDADIKFFITASSKERAKRRFLEVKDTQKDADINKIEEEIIARDKTDSNREFAPLRQADDAILVDTTNMSKEQVISFIKDKINAL